MSKFLDSIKERARSDKKTIVLPESMDRRTWEAAETVLKEDIANIVIIGTPEEVAENSKGLDISKATIIDPFNCEKTEEYLKFSYFSLPNLRSILYTCFRNILFVNFVSPSFNFALLDTGSSKRQ